MSDWYQEPTQQQGAVPPGPPNQPGAPYPAPGPAGGPPPNGRSKGPLILGIVVGVLAVVVAVLATILVVGGDTTETADSSTTTAPTSTTESTTSTTEAETTTTVDTAAAERATTATSIENILNQSANGRAEVIAVVSEVQSCDVPLSEAERRIENVIENRNSVLGQITSLRVDASADLDASLDALQRALQESVEANRHYQAWFRWLEGTYYDTYYYDGCWYDGTAPTNVDYDNAVSASGAATSAKREFVGLFNPIATELGLRTWSDTEF